jgi:hypothetical protein
MAEDLVSPCPPNVACVWSGIVNRRGTYARAGDAITLTVSGTPPPQGQPLPPTLVIDAATRAPAEDAGGTRCVYQR